MISRRNFFSIIVLMAIVLFMFQFSQVIKETESEYDVNPHAARQVISGAGRWKPAGVKGQTEAEGPPAADMAEPASFVLFFGTADSDLGSIVSQWCTYTKRELLVCGGPAQYDESGYGKPEWILIDSAVIDDQTDLDALVAYADAGIHMVFCNLPDVSVIRVQPDLRKLLGIQYVRQDRVKVEGVHLFGDFLLGGSRIYRVEREEDEKRQDLELEMPWYVTLSGTKTYMVGMLDELLEADESRNEYFPGIIWRNSYKDAKIFAVNGDYMSDLTGIGILSAMMYELNTYELYPVVNAQNLLLPNYPNFAEENVQVMSEVYSRTPKAVQQDIIWPALLSTVKRSGWKLTGFFAPQYDYTDDAEPSAENVPFYLQQFKEADAESGISLVRGPELSLADKLARDQTFYTSMNNRYIFSAAFVGAEDLPQLQTGLSGAAAAVRTVACVIPVSMPLLGYETDGITRQGVVGDAQSHTYAEDIRLRGLETALGYSCIQLDARQVLSPASDEDYWEKLYEKVSSNLDTYWKPFAAFEKTTLSESDQRLRTFLNLDYRHERQMDQVTLVVTGTEDDCWFILRTHGEGIAQMTGAEYEQIEDDAYLLHVMENRVNIRLEKNRGLLKYPLPDCG